MTKSPRAVVQEALRVARDSLPAYSSKCSRRDFTQHQLLALAVLKIFLKTDYRGLVQILADFRELRDDLGLTKILHSSTVCKAVGRLFKKGSPFISSLSPRRAPRTAA